MRWWKGLLMLAAAGVLVGGVRLAIPDSTGAGGSQAGLAPPSGEVAAPPALQVEAPPVAPPERTAPPPEPPRVLWEGPIEHIFFHPLILYPELAFDGDEMAQGYDDWMNTVPEFKGIIQQLYQNGYLLVDLNQIFTEEEGRLLRKELWLPEGKRPLILSVDDLNYYAYMRANGNAHRLILDEQGRVATFSLRPDGEPVIATDNEIIPILEAFIAEHPDFSLDGARGMLALTGYEGILGYQTHELTSPRFEEERREALKMVAHLKELGWSFAAHGWGHLDARRVSQASLAQDTQRWLDEVGALVGPTLVYVYPHGSSLLPGDPKFALLLEAGFRIFCSVGPQPYLVETEQYAMMDRRHIDGMALRQHRELLLDLFDSQSLIDPVRPGLK